MEEESTGESACRTLLQNEVRFYKTKSSDPFLLQNEVGGLAPRPQVANLPHLGGGGHGFFL